MNGAIERRRSNRRITSIVCSVACWDRIITVSHDGMHEQTPVACKQRSILALHCLKQLPIFGGIEISDIQAEQTEIA